jgi:RHS repeat-associated protein
VQRIDGKGIVTNYSYDDPDNLLTDIQYPASTSLNVHFAYDAYQRRLSMSDGTGSHSVSYDDDDNALSVGTAYTGVPAQTITYTYNQDGSRSTMVSPAGTFSYYYDANGRFSSETDPFGYTGSWTYLHNGWLSTQAISGIYSSSLSYTHAGEISASVTTLHSGSTTSFTGINHDALGNATAFTASLSGSPTIYSGSNSYQYDAKSQLLQEVSTRGSGGYTGQYAYDQSGNPTTFRGVSNSFNSNNQNTLLSYDGNGNLASYNGNALGYDPENRLNSYGAALSAGYSGDGLRAWKQTSAGKTWFLYDHESPICELDSSGNVVATNTFGPTGLLARRTGTTSSFYVFDPQGNIAQRTNDTGAVLASYFFDAYGNRTGTDASTDPFSGFGGQWGYYSDSETGLSLLTHRYYDPQKGRFITRDPIDYEGGANLYAYVQNDPVNLTDPQGFKGHVHCFFSPPGGTGQLCCYINGKKAKCCPARNRTTNNDGDPDKRGGNGPIPCGCFPLGTPYHKRGDGRQMIPVGVQCRNGICIHPSGPGKGPFGPPPIGPGQGGGWFYTNGCIKVPPDCAKWLANALNENGGGDITVTTN